VRMGVPYGDDGMAAIEVQILGALGIVNVAALAAHGLYGIEGIYVEEIHL